MHMICTGLRPGQLSVRVGDVLRRSEEIVKNLELCHSMRLLLLSLYQDDSADSYLVLQQTLGPDDLLEDVFAHVGIHSAEWVVQQIDVSVIVHSSGQAHSLLLSSTQVDTLMNEGQLLL